MKAYQGKNGLQPPAATGNDVAAFSTFKQSLSASPSGSVTSSPAKELPPTSKKLEEGYFQQQNMEQKTVRSRRGSPPEHVDIPKLASAAAMAMAALQYLPTPVIVLSALKTVVLANEAMGRLLGLDGNDDTQGILGNGDYGSRSVQEMLQGQTLSQIGVDLMHGGQIVWVNWEIFLNDLAKKMQQETQNQASRSKSRTSSREGSRFSREKHTISSAGHTSMGEDQEHYPDVSSQPRGRSPIPRRERSREASHSKERALVHDVTVDVTIALRPKPRGNRGNTVKPKPSEENVQTKMIVSTWTLENQLYYTLTFTSTAVPHLRSQTRSVTRPIKSDSIGSPSSRASPTSAGSAWCPFCGTPSTNSPSASLTVSHFPPLEPPGRSSHASAPSVLQKTLKMKDALINSMELPSFCLWKDNSLAISNQAMIQLMQRPSDPLNHDPDDILDRFEVYDPDFKERLQPDEYPVVQLCRAQARSMKWKLGLINHEGKRYTFDAYGKGVFDDKDEEFLAGIVTLKDVTEYTNIIKSQSEKNELQFQLICDTMPQMLWVATTAGLPDWFSRRWYEYTNLTTEQSLGTNWVNSFHPDDMAETLKRWEHSLKTGNEYVTEYRCKRKDGAWRWMLGRALPLRDQNSGEIIKWYGTCTDIHELVEARQFAAQTREQLLNVIQHAKVTVWAIDSNRNLTLMEGNLMWEGKQGDDRADIIGKNVYDAFGRHLGEKDLPRYMKPIETILSGKSNEFVSEHHINGNGRWFRSRFVPTFANKGLAANSGGDTITGVVGISMDISELKQRETEIEQRQQENVRLLGAETAAREASRLKSEFLANMSHEIRTPIAGCIGMSELLLDTDLDMEQRECAENIQRSANGLLTVINDILDLSKVESGRLDIEEVQFSLSVVIQDVSKMLSFAAERKGLTFTCDCRLGNDENLIVIGDPGRIRQILTNLLTNSIKFTSEGSVKLSVVARRENEESIDILFTVEDTGIGIDEEVRKRLFKPFSQADSSTARRFGGTGLGLTICKNLVDLMHGDITLDAVLGQGTTATFWIPFNKPEYANGKPIVDLGAIPERLHSEISMSQSGSENMRHGGSGTPPFSPLAVTGRPVSHSRQSTTGSVSARSSIAVDRENVLTEAQRKNIHVLVVEDNAINQQIAIKTIKKIGFSVSAVWNGQEALDYLVSQQPADGSSPPAKPDIILMDCQMPILDGYRSTYLIRNEEPYTSIPGIKTVPIVAMTASAIRGDREKCRDAGMDDYLAKPVKAKSLEQMLVKWALSIKRERRSPAGTDDSSQGPTNHDSIITAMDPFPPPIDSVPVSPGSQVPSVPRSSTKVTEPAPPLKGRPKHRGAATSTGPLHFTTPSAFSFDPKDISQNLSYTSQPLRSQSVGVDVKNHFVKGSSGILGDEDGRGIQRIEPEEIATALRNDKLILTAEETNPDRRERGKLARDHRASGGGMRTFTGLKEQEPSSETVLQLTEENVGKWEREHGGGSVGTLAKDDEASALNTSPERNQGSGESSGGRDVGGSIDADQASGVHTPASKASRATRAGMVRMESQLTVTPGRRSEAKNMEMGDEDE